MAHYDLIVLGTGGVGSAALYHAARRGLKVLGLDRFPPGHNRGSSHGESRMIRLSYFEHPDYVPLLRRSYELWDALDPALLQRCGVLYVGTEDGATIGGVRQSAQRYQLDIEERADRVENLPLVIPAGAQAVFEPDAGLLPVEDCVVEHLTQAVAAGAEHRVAETVIDWCETPAGIEVRTESGSDSAERLIVSAGAWAGEMLRDLRLPLQVLRKHVHWHETSEERYNCAFFYELEHGQFYGFPTGNGRLKLGEHSGGEPVADPLAISREPDPEDTARVEAFVADYLPGVSLKRLQHEVCLYTMTPDANFIVDRHPDSDRVAFAAGLSGHGFKFTPVLGEILVDLVLEGATELDIQCYGSPVQRPRTFDNDSQRRAVCRNAFPRRFQSAGGDPLSLAHTCQRQASSRSR